MSDTKTRILDVAERLFAEEGFAATSLRAITSEAGVNLASVNYHFGSKDELVREVFTRRLGPINRRRLAMLDAVEAEAGGGSPSLEGVVRAFVVPILELGEESGAPQLLGRIYAESGEFRKKVMGEQMGEVVRRFTAAFQQAIPDLSETETLWRGSDNDNQNRFAVASRRRLAGRRGSSIEPPASG